MIDIVMCLPNLFIISNNSIKSFVSCVLHYWRCVCILNLIQMRQIRTNEWTTCFNECE